MISMETESVKLNHKRLFLWDSIIWFLGHDLDLRYQILEI